MITPAGFEWDVAKAQANVAKHGVRFEAGVDAFQDPFHTQEPDDRCNYGEPRFRRVGIADKRLLSVTFTFRGSMIRIISVRLASRKERKSYDDRPLHA